MSLIELFILAVGLSMDAFAVSICKGLSMKKVSLKQCGKVGLYFGGFQGLMPLIGYFLGVQFKDYITSVDHWIAFVLLGFIGLNMIRESREKDEEIDINLAEAAVGTYEDVLSFKNMIMLAIATSIDALAVGVTFAFLQVDIVPAVLFIGIITFVLSMVGVKAGNIFGTKFKAKAEFAGGLILILIGLKILLEHLGLLTFP
ncbi:MAG: manganese efflux pump MntP family protein [Terrisporobacter sp.]|uniref:manganese efflux pump MntP n=1 Tax=Terrisporobacter sp. TaxID=1965305 RepID=UPI002FCBBAEF